MSESEQVNVRQTRAIVALIEHATIGDAAAACEIGESTIRRWLASDEGFRKALRDATRRMVDGAMAHAPKAADEAVKVLESIANDAGAPHTARVAAARHLDARRLRFLDALDLRDEVEELKAVVAELRRG
jgi:transposase